MDGDQAMEMNLSALSTEYVRVTATTRAAGSVITPAAPPRFAFLPTATSPTEEDWLLGEWSDRWARILIGPEGGTAVLEPGDHHVWLSWTAGAETPVYRCPGLLRVY
ncbi:hypothetical protein [Streptomyces sp. NPDC058373]|uniref:hypothetical protein n=1 Tax=Streptomyces sp. NPDC058373 TaxID=3346465 RepID=UPI0036525AA7